MRVSYVIIFVHDMQRSVTFYRDVIGLPLRFESPDWSEFATGGATLALHPSESAGRQADEPGLLPPGRCHPGLAVPDLDEFHRRVVDRGVPCLQEPQDLFGARVAQYADPDGLVISVAGDQRGETAADD